MAYGFKYNLAKGKKHVDKTHISKKKTTNLSTNSSSAISNL